MLSLLRSFTSTELQLCYQGMQGEPALAGERGGSSDARSQGGKLDCAPPNGLRTMFGRRRRRPGARQAAATCTQRHRLPCHRPRQLRPAASSRPSRCSLTRSLAHLCDPTSQGRGLPIYTNGAGPQRLRAACAPTLGGAAAGGSTGSCTAQRTVLAPTCPLSRPGSLPRAAAAAEGAGSPTHRSHHPERLRRQHSGRSSRSRCTGAQHRRACVPSWLGQGCRAAGLRNAAPLWRLLEVGQGGAWAHWACCA